MSLYLVIILAAILLAAIVSLVVVLVLRRRRRQTRFLRRDIIVNDGINALTGETAEAHGGYFSGLADADGPTVYVGRGAVPAPAPKPQATVLLIEKATARSTRVQLNGRVTLGRGVPAVQGAVVAVSSNTSVSTQHCTLYMAGGRLCLEDANSSNGTKVNGVRISAPTCLAEGDSLTLGSAELVIQHIGL